MNKFSQQDIWYFLNLFEIKPRTPITNKEAEALYNIWKNPQNDDFSAPDSVDANLLTSLTTKGFLKLRHSNLNDKTFQFTDKGKKIIRNIILYSEKSSFAKEKNKIDYSEIHNKISKIASVNKNNNNWFKKAWKL